MKNLKSIFSSSIILAAMIFISCNTEEEVPVFGNGEGKLGMAFKLATGNINSSNARIANALVLESGFIQIKELELDVDGKDDNGEFEKEIEIYFKDIKKVTFDQFDNSTDFFINIPEGEYYEIELEIDLIDYKNEPSIYIEGSFNGTPLVFEYYGDEIDFEVEIEAEDDDEYFKIDRINNPLALFEINALNWFRNVSESELENAEIKDGKILLSKEVNREIYKKVRESIKASSEIELELN